MSASSADSQPPPGSRARNEVTIERASAARRSLNSGIVPDGRDRHYTVIGGGDTGAAIRALGFPDRAFGYVSTGGGASLEFIQGKALPGLDVLEGE